MRGSMVKFVKALAPVRGRRIRAAMMFGVLGLALSGCVVYPSGYGAGYGGGYYAPPVVVGVGGGWGWGRGWGGGWHGGGGHWH